MQPHLELQRSLLPGKLASRTQTGVLKCTGGRRLCCNLLICPRASGRGLGFGHPSRPSPAVPGNGMMVGAVALGLPSCCEPQITAARPAHCWQHPRHCQPHRPETFTRVFVVSAAAATISGLPAHATALPPKALQSGSWLRAAELARKGELARDRGRNTLPLGFTGHCQPLQNCRAVPRPELAAHGGYCAGQEGGGWQPGSSSAGTAAAEALPGFLSACLSCFPHMVQEGCLLARYGAQDLSLQSSQELCPLTACASRVCWRCNPQVKAAWKPLLKGCCSQHQQELWTGFLVTSFHSSTGVSLYSCCAVKA